MAVDPKTPFVGDTSRAWEALTPALSEWILNAVSSMGFIKMTPVQASTIPLFMGNKDVVVEAVTGSGKTLSFLIPVVEKLLRAEHTKRHHVGAIIISPTRELASQIHSVLVNLLGFHPPSAYGIKAVDDEDEDAVHEPSLFSPETPKIVPQLVVGGSQTPAQDIAHFLSKSPNVLVGTPGRLLHMLISKYVQCPQSSFEVLVLDEADRLLDLGFKEDLQKILTRLPKQRRTGLFSASVSEAVDQIIRVGLRNPVRVSVKVKSATGALDKRTPMSLEMAYLITKPTYKLPALRQILEKITPTPQKSIVYLSTCAAVDYFQHILPPLLPGFSVVPLHGKYVPSVRERNFARYIESAAPTILLTTDVAARGLDIPMVDLVIQLDPPSDSKVFLHRCGRAGRAGRRGLAITFLTPGREEDYINFLAVRKTPVTELETPQISISDDEPLEVSKKIRSVVLADRAIHDKAQKAFVSWVRSYSKHQASSIFRVTDLDWTEMANSWGLLRMPKMPELKEWTGNQYLGQSIDFAKYAYKDKQKEKHRLEDVSTYEKSKVLKRSDRQSEKNDAWSGKKALKETKEVRREKRRAKREGVRRSNMTEDEAKEMDKLDSMIAEVRKRNETGEEEWNGFSD